MAYDQKTKDRALAMWTSSQNFADVSRKLGMSQATARKFITGHHRYGAATKILSQLSQAQDRLARLRVELSQDSTPVPVESQHPLDKIHLPRQDRAEQMFQSYVEGLTLREIAEAHGLSSQRVLQLLRTLPQYLKLRDKLTAPINIDDAIIHKWKRGYPYTELAKILGTSRWRLVKALQARSDFKEVDESRYTFKNPHEVQLMVDYYNSGKTLKEVGAKFGYAESSAGEAVGRLLRRHPDYKPRKVDPVWLYQ